MHDAIQLLFSQLKSTDPVEQKLHGFCSWLGISAVFVPLGSYPDYAYSNYTIRYVGSCDSLRVSNLAHDIAHYLVAPKSRRKNPDFGLGSSPDSTRTSVSQILDPRPEEKDASALGVFIEHFAGHDVTCTRESHNWRSRWAVRDHLYQFASRTGMLSKMQGPEALDAYGFDEDYLLSCRRQREARSI